MVKNNTKKVVNKKTLAIVVPVFNESAGILQFHTSLVGALKELKSYTKLVLYINDGSQDDSAKIISGIKSSQDIKVELVDFSRNFGKEAAVSAGIAEAYSQKSSAIMILDADGQHPVSLISSFVSEWESGSEVIIGIRANSKHEGIVKKIGSKVFYSAFNKFTGVKLIPGSTDFRLIDAQVAAEFVKLPERSRMTRGLIDWLGFNRSFITFDALERQHGTASYSAKKLFQLAINSFVSLSMIPLYISGYLGILFMTVAFLVGAFIFVQQFILSDPLQLGFSGPVIIGVVLVFLVGIILSSIGLLALYIAKILEEAQDRPLYIIRKGR